MACFLALGWFTNTQTKPSLGEAHSSSLPSIKHPRLPSPCKINRKKERRKEERENERKQERQNERKQERREKRKQERQNEINEKIQFVADSRLELALLSVVNGKLGRPPRHSAPSRSPATVTSLNGAGTPPVCD